MITVHHRRIRRPAALPQRRKRTWAGRRGVAAAELAVCLPVVVLLVLATIEACSMIFLKQSLTVASYEGARRAIVKNATVSDIQAACNQILADRKIKDATVTVTPVNKSALKPGDAIDITVTAPCGRNTVLPVMFYRGRTMESRTSMMIEF